MAIGFGKGKKAGRLEVEVAADMEDFDEGMAKVRSEAEKTGSEASGSFRRMKAAISASIAGLSVFIGAHFGQKIPGMIRKSAGALSAFGQGGGQQAFAKVTNRLGVFAAVLGAKVAPAILALTTTFKRLASVIGGTAVFRVLVNGAGRASRAFGVLVKSVRGFSRLLTPVLQLVVKFSDVLANTFLGTLDLAAIAARGLGKALKALGTRLRKEGKILGAFGLALQGTGSIMERFGRTMGKIIGFIVKFKFAMAAALTTLAALSARSAGKFGNSFARVETLLQDMSEGGLNTLRADVAKLRREIGVTSEVINDTFYQVLSAMPQFANDASQALGILKVATDVATTGFADGEVAVRAITGIMNAWKLETEEAILVSDALFAAQNQGVTTFGEIAESIGSVSGLTAALGGDWRDLLAIVATVSPFIQTSEVLTGVSAVLAGVLEASPEARKEAGKIGLDFSTAALEAAGLIPFIEDIVDKTEGKADVIAKLFGRKEASQLIITLSRNMGELSTKMDEVTNSAGTSAAVIADVADTSAKAGERMGAAFDGLLEALGRELEPIVIRAKDFVGGALNFLTDRVDALRIALQNLAEAWKLENFGPFGKLLIGGGRGAIAIIADITRAEREALKAIEENRQDFLDKTSVELTGKDKFGRTHTFRIPTGRSLEQEQARRRTEAAAELRAFEERVLENPDFRGNLSEGQLAERARLKPVEPVNKGFVPPPPIGLESSRAFLAEREANLTAQAVLTRVATGDAEAYAKALVDIQNKMRELTIAERNRLVAAGELPSVANQLLTGLIFPDDPFKEATAGLNELLFSVRILQGLGIEAFADVKPAVSELAAEITSLTRELDSTLDLLTEVDPENAALVAEGAERIQSIEAELVVLRARLALFREMEPVIKSVGIGLVQLGQELPAEQMELFNIALETFTVGIDAVTAAQGALASAELNFGEGSDEAAAATKKLTEAQSALKLIMRQVEAILKAAKIPLEQITEIMEKLAGISGNPDLQVTQGSFWEWIIKNHDLVEGLARGLLAVGDALGIIGEEASQALKGVIDLAGGLKKIATGDKVGGAAQTIGGLVGLVGGLFGGGESEEDKQRRLAVEKNTDALRKLSNSLDAQRQIIGGASGELLATLRDAFDFTQGPPLGTVKSADEFARRKLQQNLDLLDLTVGEVNDMLEQLGIEFRLTRDDGELVGDDIRKIRDALALLELEDFFAGFEGSLDRLRREFEIMDIDDATEQLTRYVDILREFTGLDVPDFDLSTAEGRAGLEQFIRETFARATDLSTDELGKLNITELLDLFGTIESLVDTVDGGPDAESFQEFKGITEITANRLAGLLTTDVYWNEITAQNVRAIVSLLGGSPIGADPSFNPVPNFDPSRFPGPDISREPIEVVDNSVEIGTLELTVMQADPSMDAGELATEIAGELNTQLGNNLRRQTRDNGLVTTRTAR